MNGKTYNLTVSELLERAYQSNPQQEVLFDGYSRMSYEDLRRKSFTLALSLQRMGIEKGDKIAVCLPNWNEFVVIYFALAHLGAMIVPFNTRYRSDEIEYVLKNSEAKLAFFTNEFDGVNHVEQFTKAIKQVDTLQSLITVRYENEQFIHYEQLIERDESALFEPLQFNPQQQIFSILYTSGSTGPPKGAMLTTQML